MFLLKKERIVQMNNIWSWLIELLSQDGVETLVLLITALIVAYYTWETYQIRKQSDRKSDPLLALDYEFSGTENSPFLAVSIRNASRTPAHDVVLTNQMGKNILRTVNITLDGVPIDELFGPCMTQKSGKIGLFLPEHTARLEVGVLRGDVDITELNINYKNSAGLGLETKYKVVSPERGEIEGLFFCGNIRESKSLVPKRLLRKIELLF